MYIKHPSEIEANNELINEIQRAVPHLAFDLMSRLLYSTDASIYQMVPVGVVFPQNADQVSTVVEIASNHCIPVLPRGGGSSLAGQAINHAIIIDFSRYMDSIIEVNEDMHRVRTMPGITLNRLNKEVSKYGLMYGPDPASGDRATIGGVIGNNATGSHSIVYGMTHDHVVGLEMVLHDGKKVHFSEEPAWTVDVGTNSNYLYKVKDVNQKYQKDIESRYPKTFRNAAGYNLNILNRQSKPNLCALFTGSEGTLGVITEATLKLVPVPKKKALALVNFVSLKEAMSAVPTLLESKPTAIEMIDKMLLDLIREKPHYHKLLKFIEGDPEVILVVEYSGDSESELTDGVSRLKSKLRSIGHNDDLLVLTEKRDQDNVWYVRKVGLGILLSVKCDEKPITFIEDAAVPVQNLSDYLTQISDYAKEIGIDKVGMYAHASAGCIHVRPLINLKTKEGIGQMRKMAEKSAGLVIGLGGTTSGEHGEGISRSEFSRELFGEELTKAFKEIKTIFDPQNIFNPGKIVDPPKMDDESLLRYGTGYKVPQEPQKTILDFSGYGGFARAVEMCNGAGVCRQEHHGVMCPSYQATRDETHSTRGRANALRAAMMGWLGTKGMTDERLYEVLDLCLSCQACSTECPSGVDMAKLKAEFLYGYYKEHGKPLRSILFGNIAEIDRLLQPIAGLANIGMKFPGKQIMQLVGVHEKRSLPEVTAKPFTKLVRLPIVQKERTVVFFHDTFMEHNHPQVGLAAIKVIEAAGYTPMILENKKCCGRPAYSKGLLDEAKAYAEHNISVLAPFAQAGIPIIGCEPSCMAMLVNEYLSMVPGGKARSVADMSRCIDSFIMELHEKGELDLEFDHKPRKVLFHGHCQQKANFGTADTLNMLRMIPECHIIEIDSGCCGMAGSFGYEKEHYDLSIKLAEMRLAPAIRDADNGVIICAAGTSCRDQIQHTTGRIGLHPIQVFAEALV